MKLSTRIESIPKYLFAELDEIKRRKIEEGKEIIDLGIGDPDLPTHSIVVQKLVEEASNPQNHRYPSYEGDVSFRKEFVSWYSKRFGVDFSPDEAVVLIGSKEGIAHIHLAFVDSGDTVICPNPAYPVYSIWSRFCGGKVYDVFLKEEKDFLLDIESVPSDVLSSAKMLWICYPNNPTAACADEEYYKKIAFYSKKYGFVVAVDLAYSEIYFDENKKPISFFQAVKDKSVPAVEFHSFSKTFSMAGWRVGMAIGNKEVISALRKVKTNTDSGVFRAVQMSAKVALENYDKIVPAIREEYRSRKEKIVPVLRKAGFKFRDPEATFYIWIKCGGDSREFAKMLIEKYGVILTPGVGFGDGGEGFVRISLTTNQIDRAAEILARVSV
ncbi:MAG: aminotransferase class I/II-fold pyridoxal phosphate-dependent enzyme [Candidatus Calescibacterium sp.]|nr:aminotransferase class I/II-fold pyridoxal phosphate-dependent enzyme [Candidatus Calescibacterium sp.]